jgi:hypothetical protein
MRPLLALLLTTSITGHVLAQAKLKPEDTPSFKLRARITSVGKEDPAGKKFSFRLSVPSAAPTSTGKEWSDWLTFGDKQIEATLKGYPANYLKGYPVVVRLSVGGVVDPTLVEAELKFDETGEVFPLTGELYGPSLGILLWRDDKKRPQGATMAVYNRRYWKVLEGVEVPPAQRPKRFPIVDRFIGGDDDRTDWREGVEQLSRAGFSAIMLPPSRPIRDVLLKAGYRRTAWAVYSPPGYAFDHDARITPEAIADWAKKQAKPYLDAGYAPEDMALFALSDEPGWYYPHAFKALEANPAALARFHDYLEKQGLKLADVGAEKWADVRPLGRSKAVDLPSRRLFYWTMRFYAWDSARHFAECTKALEKEFYPGLPILTNWNFFSGRLYVPGPVANNSAKTDPDAAMGGHDWMEFGRMRGGTILWTEDWFADAKAYQWSFYCSKLRCAAEKGGVQFGGYVIPRTAGDREDGIVQKILCVVGSGGKAIKYFVFGPEYNFPGNCYSERARVMPKMAEAHRMIGAAEDVLWPGKRPRPEVAILLPRSAQMWDAKKMAVARGISDATNHNLNGATVDYMAEVYNLYLALQHANVPVDFVEEDDLSAAGLKPYRVLYLTAPNVPEENQRGLAEWVRSGGTLVTVTGAAARDRYDDPCAVLADAVGIKEKPRERLLVANANVLKEIDKGRGANGDFTAFGVRGTLETRDGVEAMFANGDPAVVRRGVGKGRVVHFAWLPGLSYWRSATAGDKGTVYSASARRWVTWATELAGVRPPVKVDQPLIETPLLLSDAGAAVTLLNWTGSPVDKLRVSVRLPFKVRTIESIRHGPLSYDAADDEVAFSVPLGAVDIIKLKK